MIEQEIERSYKTLKKGGIILYPTDTIWGIGCDATNKEAVKKIYSLKKRSKNKALIILIAEYTNLYKLIDKVSPNAHKEMNNEKPTTVIFNNVKNVSKEILAEDGSAAIRLANDNFCQRLIIKLGQPIVSTSANISGGPNPDIFSDINNELIENVDYIVNLRQDEIMNKPSSIIKINIDGSIKKIR
jgi:L-threonylcarbamoyladenylate synthase